MNGFLKDVLFRKDFNKLFKLNVINTLLLSLYIILFIGSLFGIALFSPMFIALTIISILLIWSSLVSIYNNRRTLMSMSNYTNIFGTTTEKINHHINCLCFYIFGFYVFKTENNHYLLIKKNDFNKKKAYKAVNLTSSKPSKISMAL